MSWNSELASTLPQLSQTGVLENVGICADNVSIESQGMLGLELFAGTGVRFWTWWQGLSVVFVAHFCHIGEESAKWAIQ